MPFTIGVEESQELGLALPAQGIGDDQGVATGSDDDHAMLGLIGHAAQYKRGTPAPAVHLRPMMWFWLGVALGVLACVPLVWIASIRTARRVRALESNARASERLAEQGKLTGGLAHEIKNPLSTVGLNIQLIQEDLADMARQGAQAQGPDQLAANGDKLARIQRRTDALWRETQRLKEILEDFLRFAGRVRLDIAATDVNQLVDDLTGFFAPQAAAAGVRVRTKLEAQPPEIQADAALVKQALLNLLLNAIQAMSQARLDANKPHGGCDELIVSTQRLREVARDEVRIHVIDTGPGIDPKHRGEIFAPYFSTKKSGTGLGLPTSRRIIEEHGGQLDVHSELGRGSDFVITLPTAGPVLKPDTLG